MKKLNIKLTLEGTETSEDYDNLRDEMVEDLVDIKLETPTPEMLKCYKKMLSEEFRNMSDGELQALHGQHIEYYVTKVTRNQKSNFKQRDLPWDNVNEEESWQSSVNEEPIL
jgi:hypothetical protein